MPIVVGLGGEHQRSNAALAVQLCATFEAERLAVGAAAPGGSVFCVYMCLCGYGYGSG